MKKIKAFINIRTRRKERGDRLLRHFLTRYASQTFLMKPNKSVQEVMVGMRLS